MNEIDPLSPPPNEPAMEAGFETEALSSIPDEIPGLAPFRARAGAFFIDCVVLSLLLFVLQLPLLPLMQDPKTQLWAMSYLLKAIEGDLGDKLVILGVMTVLLALVLIPIDLYFIVMEYTRGATIGKRWFRLQVLTLDGNRLTLRQCVLREMLRHVDLLLIVPGVLGICFGGRRQRLGDWAAGTIVAHVSDGPPWEDPMPGEVPRV
jgi:uncharacterized RDD family membrane protein YckC